MLPTSDEQIRFLVQIQRLLDEGLFVATYKFALLQSLADIAVERGDDFEASLAIPTNAIAEKFIRYLGVLAKYPQNPADLRDRLLSKEEVDTRLDVLGD